jgi:CHASE2 domain-containing sensor protein
MTSVVLPADEGRLIDGKYQLDMRIGQGAMGVVYRAEHIHLRRTVAVKLLAKTAPDPEAVLRFRREAETLGRLRHANVVDVIDFGIDPEERRPYLVMEYLEGESVEALCAREGRLSVERALPILGGVAAAIDQAHAQSILHRDLKPGNVILLRDGGAKVLDFGLARLVSSPDSKAPVPPEGGPADLTGSGALLGTPIYAAPELFRGIAPTTASDVYSFGVFAYELVSGRPPFRGTTAEVMEGHLRGAIPDPASFGARLPGPVVDALREALAKDPAARPRSAAAVIARLDAARLTAAQSTWRRREAPRRALLATVLALGSAAVGPWLATLEPVAAFDRRGEDLQFALRPATVADPRIRMLSIDDASLTESPLPLAARPDEVVKTLDALFGAGAKGVAVDILLPASWRTSPAFAELLLRQGDRLRLAAMADTAGTILGTDCVADATATALGAEGVSRLFGLVNVSEDPSGRIRDGRLFFRETTGGRRQSWAAAASSLLGIAVEPEGPFFVLDQSIERRAFWSLSWAALRDMLAHDPQAFRGTLVLVGDRLNSGDDVHHLPSIGSQGGSISGLLLQAIMVQTLLEGTPVRRPGLGIDLALAATSAVLAAGSLLWTPSVRRGIWVGTLLTGTALAIATLSFHWTDELLPIATFAATALLAASLALLARRQLPRYPFPRS